MKITCGKREDILKRKAEYEADYAEKKGRYNEQYNKLKDAEDVVCNGIKSMIEDALGPVSIQLDIWVQSSWGVGVVITIRSNENNVHGTDKALSWSWETRLGKDGQVIKETSSWSGLKATTREQLDSLKETLRILEILNTIDWQTIHDDAKANYPKYEDYVTERNPDYETKPNFDNELFEVDIEECIGQPVLLKSTVRGWASLWYGIVKETPKQYEVFSIHGNLLSPSYLEDKGATVRDVVDANKRYTERITKDKLKSLLVKPLEKMEY